MRRKLCSVFLVVALLGSVAPAFAEDGRFERFSSTLRHDSLYQDNEGTRGAVDELLKSGRLRELLSRWDATTSKASRSPLPKPYQAENAFNQFEKFFEQFKGAVFVSAAEEVADMTKFPLVGSDILYANAVEPGTNHVMGQRGAFIASFDRIFDSFTRSVLYNKQAEDADLKYEDNCFKYRVSVLQGSVDPSTGEIYESSTTFMFERVEGEFKLVGMIMAG